MVKFLLDSGDPNEYKEICDLAKKAGLEIWGATTNPSLIAKKLEGKKVSQKEAFELQKQIVLEIINLVPGGVSAEVYASPQTKAEEMIKQGLEIASCNPRVYVKIPTTLEGFKARTILRKEKVLLNNTLVFSQEQIFAICLHERIIQKTLGIRENSWPSFISPFVGRLDDIGKDGMSLIENGMKIKGFFDSFSLWMLEASVRKVEHIKRGIKMQTDLITAPISVYKEWFSLSSDQRESLNADLYNKALKKIDYWNPPQEFLSIESFEEFNNLLETGKLNINHPLTDRGIIRFVEDWNKIIKI